jgi:hypothetical protein
MEQNTNASGMMNGMPPVAKENKKVGPILGALVIVLVIIIAALYFFGQKLNTTPVTPEVNTEETTGTSSEAAVIESDLDAQLKDIDYSF